MQAKCIALKIFLLLEFASWQLDAKLHNAPNNYAFELLIVVDTTCGDVAYRIINDKTKLKTTDRKMGLSKE